MTVAVSESARLTRARCPTALRLSCEMAGAAASRAAPPGAGVVVSAGGRGVADGAGGCAVGGGVVDGSGWASAAAGWASASTGAPRDGHRAGHPCVDACAEVRVRAGLRERVLRGSPCASIGVAYAAQAGSAGPSCPRRCAWQLAVDVQVTVSPVFEAHGRRGVRRCRSPTWARRRPAARRPATPMPATTPPTTSPPAATRSALRVLRCLDRAAINPSQSSPCFR